MYMRQNLTKYMEINIQTKTKELCFYCYSSHLMSLAISQTVKYSPYSKLKAKYRNKHAKNNVDMISRLTLKEYDPNGLYVLTVTNADECPVIDTTCVSLPSV